MRIGGPEFRLCENHGLAFGATLWDAGGPYGGIKHVNAWPPDKAYESLVRPPKGGEGGGECGVPNVECASEGRAAHMVGMLTRMWTAARGDRASLFMCPELPQPFTIAARTTQVHRVGSRVYDHCWRAIRIRLALSALGLGVRPRTILRNHLSLDGFRQDHRDTEGREA